MKPKRFLDGRVTLRAGDCLKVLAQLPENSVDAIVTDPPYHLTSITERFGAIGAAPAKSGKTGAFKRAGAGFMGKKWDGGDIAFRPGTWRAMLRVLKPGGYLVAFASTKGFGRMQVAIEDAGFISHPLTAFLTQHPDAQPFLESLSDSQVSAFMQLLVHNDLGGMLGWVFGSGFPKATRIAAPGYEGWRYGGQALKPAIEPIYMGQKPFSEANGTDNILLWGTGGINIDGCRVPTEETLRGGAGKLWSHLRYGGEPQDNRAHAETASNLGRWPANLIHDGSDSVVSNFPATAGAFAPVTGDEPSNTSSKNVYQLRDRVPSVHHGDSGSAARFFYSAKATAEDRVGAKHPTVKPLGLKQYLCRMVTPPGGVILDPFAGTGTTGEAAFREGFRAVLIEREPEYIADIIRRLELAADPAKRAAVVAAAGEALHGAEGTPLFSDTPKEAAE
ncbi:site-specific DNA-methyltransferase (adenine-specific) [Devosia crocina]|uniref:Methyltransferase n=1 Tax=Devosia crocina TaxID=429728 RepID=A0A1I7N9G5_9HYPH|nr:site-specific DNA-methyltransferase [Devosia crocina]SFV31223.1 site-specific DNA-methyltransferase (adenine-specific) [Devosia crocina]